ncbi:FRG domain-containing protein [Pyramidobacter sp. SM-530-WT-4B]|uniref:FRG domain-containing protein n=1 Tax=Pyramidobacter porci TaxID=2605789 RepID=A0A6L5YD35_9BACT|nr:FRG domain-containing protein [Pyramidobacter porci]MST55477.1 FRG domain-containing protein [Pyramidobacter porci]
MEDEDREEYLSENGIEVNSLADYIKQINELYSDKEAEAQQLYFRGQQSDVWDIQPVLFRENNLINEHFFMSEPKVRRPEAFQNMQSDFEIMTKCQHYGLSTRLLDVTRNPLVAMYFACQPCDNIDDSIFNAGVIYSGSNYSVPDQSKDVQIITALSKQDLSSGENKLISILDRLYERGIITQSDCETWKQEYEKFIINKLQTNLLVSPTYSNERLLRQNGMFILPACFVISGDTIDNFTITKGTASLKQEFNETIFFVKENNKSQILKELDRCDINESTLFPELEHLLSYLHESRSSHMLTPSFEKYERVANPFLTNIQIADDVYKNSTFKIRIFDKCLNGIDASIKEEVWKAILDGVKTRDWYKRGQTLSGMRVNIKGALNKSDKPTKTAKEIVDCTILIAQDIAKEKSQ